LRKLTKEKDLKKDLSKKSLMRRKLEKKKEITSLLVMFASSCMLFFPKVTITKIALSSKRVVLVA
jgi:hypothetical protein